MSKSSELDQTVKKYILECIDNSGYSDKELTQAESIQFLKDTFYREKDREISKQGEQAALADHLPGLPSYFNIEYRNHSILELAVKWGSIPENYTEAQADTILNNWWGFIANKTCQLFRGYRVPEEPIRVNQY